MLCIILKAFAYSADGRFTVTMPAGEQPVEIRDDLVEGLKAAGYLRRAAPGARQAGTAPTSAPVVLGQSSSAAGAIPPAPGASAALAEIPANWASKEFGFFKLQGLVLKLTGVKPANKADAAIAMNAELARRAALPV